MKKLTACLVMLVTIYSSSSWSAEQPTNGDKLDKGLMLDLWYGGWEPDYTKTAYEAMLSYRGLDNIHLMGGYGSSSQVYYDRTKVYAGGYYFYQDYSYLRIFLSQKVYEYPIAPGAVKPNPDSSSYNKVPRLELEASQYFNPDIRGTVTYEVSRPDFFYDPDTVITTQKLSGELATTITDAWRAKALVALLRDPDPSGTSIKGFVNPAVSPTPAPATNAVFRTSSLYGGALQYAAAPWDIEVKYLQNRDLDSSYSYSLLSKIAYRINDTQQLQLDHVYDKFSSQSSLAGMNANVYMASYFHHISPALRLGLGYKHIDVPNRMQDTGFILLQTKTGML